MTSINSSAPHDSKVNFPYKGGAHSFLPEQIIRLESDSNYTLIYTTNSRPIIMAKVLAKYETMLLPFGFIRTHRSHLINKRHISNVDPRGMITMDDQSTVKISRRKRREVVSKMQHRPHAA